MGLQRVRHDLAIEQQQQNCYYCILDINSSTQEAPEHLKSISNQAVREPVIGDRAQTLADFFNIAAVKLS